MYVILLCHTIIEKSVNHVIYDQTCVMLYSFFMINLVAH